ncbi:MAG: RNA recognition motif domain-containing protein [Planctomycetota bacterium]|jgi:RNA recognition motif-containing protein
MNIYVGNLPFAITEAELQAAFEAHGEVSEAKIITDRNTGRSRGFGFIEMVDDEEAQSAIDALNGMEMGDRKLVVNKARAKDRDAKG